MSDFDLVVRGATVVDGTGAPAREADVAVRAGRIVTVGDDAARRGDEQLDWSTFDEYISDHVGVAASIGNGVVAIREGRSTGARPGRFLRAG